DESKALETLKQISMGGAKVAIDDFGTGYSSMSRLRNLPIDQIKIDRCFVRDVVDNPQDKAIVDATVFLAKSLGCSVTAEGVETAQAAQQLRSIGCDFMQGFHFARPQPADEVYALLRQVQAAESLPKAS
ncbi:MAG: EAL domain-containing protein, partial [Granulosicoccaceae bacterium]